MKIRLSMLLNGQMKVIDAFGDRENLLSFNRLLIKLIEKEKKILVSRLEYSSLYCVIYRSIVSKLISSYSVYPNDLSIKINIR